MKAYKILNNVGNKIQLMAKFLMVLGTIGGGIVLLYGIFQYSQNANCLEYSKYLGSEGYGYDALIEAGDKAYLGLKMIKFSLVAIVSSVIGALPLVGFGVLVENSDQVKEQNKEIIKYLNEAKKRDEERDKKEISSNQGVI